MSNAGNGSKDPVGKAFSHTIIECPTGEVGEKAFPAGADGKHEQGMTAAGQSHWQKRTDDVCSGVTILPEPLDRIRDGGFDGRLRQAQLLYGLGRVHIAMLQDIAGIFVGGHGRAAAQL